MANAYYMFFSRDPHLAAIGFVWNPLPSFVDIPLMLLKFLWAPLVSRALAAAITDALLMSASVLVLSRMLCDLSVRRGVRLAITALYALNPMIVYYGSNGMSEGLFLCMLMVTCRHLLLWIDQRELKPLTVSGAALGLAYLSRNEAVFAAAFGILVVGGLSIAGAQGRLSRRLLAATTECTIFGAPFVVCFVGWAVTSWIIVGNPFEQFSSIYGTTSQLRVINQFSGPGGVGAGGVSLVSKELFALCPLLILVCLAAVYHAISRRDLRVLAPTAIFGGVLIFAVLAFIAGQTAGWFRYYLTEVPLACTFVGCIFSGGVYRQPRYQFEGRIFVTAAAVFLLGPSLLTSANAMRNRSVGREETLHLEFIWASKSKLTTLERGDERRWAEANDIAADLDRRRLPHGSVLVDNFDSCVPYLILDSHRPQQFVIPNDRDFQRILADPVTFHTGYFLVPPSTGYGALDAVNRAFPSLYLDGNGVATLVVEYHPSGCPPFRLYRLKVTPPGSNGPPVPRITS